MRNQPPEFANVVLDALTAHIAVLDEHGVIIGVNEPWRRFSEANQGRSSCYYVGENYLSVCENAARCGGDKTAAALIDGLRSVLRGQRSRFALEYPCHSPDEERWFIVWVTPCSQGGASRVVVAHEDITARKKAELALARAELTLRKILDTLPVGVWVMDRNGHVIQGNAAGQKIWGVSAAQAPELLADYKGWWLDSGKPVAAAEWAAARAISRGETSIEEKILIEGFDGSRKIILNSSVPLHDADNKISGAIIVNQDITARHEADEQLRRAKLALEQANRELQESLQREKAAAQTDELTGLCNRRHFFSLGGQLFKVALRYGTPLAVVMLDVDHFKRINDTHGHQAGDRTLSEIARRAAGQLRAADLLARYGGEEMVLLLPESTAAQALQVAEGIRTAVAAQPVPCGQTPVPVSLSAGIAEIDALDGSLDAIIRRADRALYEAKASGRNCCRIFGPQTALRSTESTATEF
ncbi:MAG TPA: diguanylate cyclase [Nevskiaceae bacterium]|nr:diguanylate cyclase [Nevskiaceae bacterium]